AFLCVTCTPHFYTLSLHDALPIWFRPDGGDRASTSGPNVRPRVTHAGIPSLSCGFCFPLASCRMARCSRRAPQGCDQRALRRPRSEEHTSELQSRFDLVCRLLLEK